MKFTLIVLAAGLGTRMKSAVPKVLHEVAGITMLEHVLKAAQSLDLSEIRVVVSQEVLAHHKWEILQHKYGCTAYVQSEKKGTGHALSTALHEVEEHNIVVASGDSPLLMGDSMMNLANQFISNSAAIQCAAFKAKNPMGYGRIMLNKNDDISRITECKDLSPLHKQLDLCNAGIYVFDKQYIHELINALDCNNEAHEFYLTDVLQIATEQGLKSCYTLFNEEECMGVNNKMQQAQADRVMQDRLRLRLMMEGVTLIDPETVFISGNCSVGRDVVIHPYVTILGDVRIGDGVVIHSFSHIQDAEIGGGCSIGPYARLRPGSLLDNDVKVGNFVEIKGSHLHRGVKVNHLSYIGDAEVGSESNIGAGVVFCNYDGDQKHKTHVGKKSFIGSNVSLVAPLSIGNKVCVGAGSTITKDIPDDSLAICRAKDMVLKNK